MSINIIPGPVPAYANVPIHPENYQPRNFEISDVELGIRTTVTTVNDMDYVIGQLIRLIIPRTFGCRQLNEKIGYVIEIPTANQVIVDINSSENVDPFVLGISTTKPQINAVGDVNNGYINSTGRVVPATNIPGSFINIS